MLRNKIIRFKKIYKFYFDHFLTKCTVFVLIVKNVIKNQKFNFPDKLRHTKKMLRKYCDENVFFKVDRALSKLITLLISNKQKFNHFFKSRSSDIVLLKLGNLHQNAKPYEPRKTERKTSCARSECASEANRFFFKCSNF